MSFNFNPTNFQKSEINPPATHFYPWQLAQTNSFLYIPLSVTHQIQQPLRPLTLPAYPPFKATQQPASPPMQFVPLFPLPAPNFLNIGSEGAIAEIAPEAKRKQKDLPPQRIAKINILSDLNVPKRRKTSEQEAKKTVIQLQKTTPQKIEQPAPAEEASFVQSWFDDPEEFKTIIQKAAEQKSIRQTFRELKGLINKKATKGDDNRVEFWYSFKKDAYANDVYLKIFIDQGPYFSEGIHQESFGEDNPSLHHYITAYEMIADEAITPKTKPILKIRTCDTHGEITNVAKGKFISGNEVVNFYKMLEPLFSGIPMYIFDDSHIYLDPNELPKPKTTGFIRLLRSVTAGETWYESTLGCKIASVTNWKKHVDENPINQVPEEYQTARERLQQVTLRDIYLPLEKKQKGDPITKDHWVQEKAKIEKKLQRDLIENISKLAQQCKIIHTQTRLPVFKEAYDLFSQEKDLTKILETSTLLVKDLTATLMKFTRINAEDPSLPEEQKSTIKLASLAFKQFALYAFPQRYASPESPEEWEKIQQLQAPIRQYAEDVRTIFESYVFVIAP